MMTAEEPTTTTAMADATTGREQQRPFLNMNHNNNQQQLQEHPTVSTAVSPSVVYEPLHTFDNKENSYNNYYNGPLSTRDHFANEFYSPSKNWVDNMVKVATAANKLVRKNCCNLCHVYVDKQVEFEEKELARENEQHQHQGMGTGNSPTERLWSKMNTENLEVEVYRQFLFDESSVGLGLLDSAMDTACEAVTTPSPAAASAEKTTNEEVEQKPEEEQKTTSTEESNQGEATTTAA